MNRGQPVAVGASAAAVARPGEGLARIGPNSILQTVRALQELESPQVLTEVKHLAAVPDPLPGGMIPEAWFVAMVGAVRQVLAPDRAAEVLRRSGTYTAQYVSKNRIPAPVRAFLAVAPRQLAVPMLLKAFARNAWTFAGAGHYESQAGLPGIIWLEGCPTARAEALPPRAGPCCTYYEAAFEGLLSLAVAPVRVREVACQSAGAPRCRFQFTLGDTPCASS